MTPALTRTAVRTPALHAADERRARAREAALSWRHHEDDEPEMVARRRAAHAEYDAALAECRRLRRAGHEIWATIS